MSGRRLSPEEIAGPGPSFRTVTFPCPFCGKKLSVGCDPVPWSTHEMPPCEEWTRADGTDEMADIMRKYRQENFPETFD